MTARPTQACERAARVVCWNREDGKAYKALVSLSADAVVSWAHQPDGQPNMTVDEVHECDVAMRREPRVIEALARRGITEMDRVLVEAWAYGAHLLPEPYSDRRLGWADVWYRSQEGSNPYANPVTGLHLVIDLNTMELLEVEDTGVIEEPATMGEYVPRLVPGQQLRSDVKPLHITQPDGPSFALDGNLLRWQRWSMRVGFNYREGLVLHAVGYEDSGRVRAVAHRLSFAEMVVPYRDPTSEHYRRTAFDIGEWGLGFMTTSLELGCDCLGEIAYLDAVLHDTAGEPYTITNAVCIHEEDDGVLWKHVDDVSGAETRRMRRLAVSFHVTVGNYEYLVYWRFHQDGTIQAEVRATGIMVTTHFAEGRQPPYGTLVDERTYAPFHQHFLVARLDLDVDGDANTVVCSESEVPPIGPDNPHGVALVQRERAAAHGVRGDAGLRLVGAARLEGDQPRRAQRPGRTGGLQARARRLLPRDAVRRLTRPAPRPGARPHAVGDAVRGGGALAVRRVRRPKPPRPRAAGVDGGEPAHRGHRRRPLVRLRHPPHHPPRGVAGHAGGHRLLLAQARRVL